MVKTYTNNKVILEQLTQADASFFYGIYSHPQLIATFDESPFLPNETPLEFTDRIMSLCEYIFTIRSRDTSHLIIGDCALHHWNKESCEVSIGGSLYPEYWGKGYMQSAFELLEEIAKKDLRVKILLASTRTNNRKAIRLMEKMGFERKEVNDNDLTMQKHL